MAWRVDHWAVEAYDWCVLIFHYAVVVFMVYTAKNVAIYDLCSSSVIVCMTMNTFLQYRTNSTAFKFSEDSRFSQAATPRLLFFVFFLSFSGYESVKLAAIKMTLRETLMHSKATHISALHQPSQLQLNSAGNLQHFLGIEGLSCAHLTKILDTAFCS